MPVTSIKSPGYPHFCPTWQGVPTTDFHCRSQQFTRLAHSTLEDTYILLPACYNGHKRRTKWRGTQDEIPKDPKHENIHPLGVGICSPPSTWMHSTTLKLPEPCHLGHFMEVSLHRQDSLNHWSLVIYSISSLSPLARGCWVGLKVVSFQSRQVLFWWPALPKPI